MNQATTKIWGCEGETSPRWLKLNGKSKLNGLETTKEVICVSRSISGDRLLVSDDFFVYR
jgi:hypothetical protein